jgi:hypothetical protein
MHIFFRGKKAAQLIVATFVIFKITAQSKIIQ